MTWTWRDDDPATSASAENLQTHVELRLRALEVAGGGGGSAIVLHSAAHALAQFADVYPPLVQDALSGDDITLDGDGNSVNVTAGIYLISAAIQLYGWDGTDGQRNVQVYIDGLTNGGTIHGEDFPVLTGDNEGNNYRRCITRIEAVTAPTQLKFNWSLFGGGGTGHVEVLSFVRLADVLV